MQHHLHSAPGLGESRAHVTVHPRSSDGGMNPQRKHPVPLQHLPGYLRILPYTKPKPVTGIHSQSHHLKPRVLYMDFIRFHEIHDTRGRFCVYINAFSGTKSVLF